MAVGTDLVMVDLSADRYHALHDAVATADEHGSRIGGAAMKLVPGAIDALLLAGVLVDTDVPPLPPLPAPSRGLASPVHPSKARHPADVPRLALATLHAAARLRGGLPCSTYLRERPSREACPNDVEEAIARYAKAKLLLPTPSRCLPASLGASRFLAGLGVPNEIVFGVRTHPFEAHCWVEHGGCVLNDTLERVQAFAPVMVGMP
ncbi:lasso peptide biosynthesis B2 protein [Sphingomonas melonis]|uniref:Microcin J25-processing protein McjB C-terminal domain-containing protein n=1 Tax=Sphingomonas melonis TaxID=152682 RepID=A0A7Y9K296_9SPHN|nr:hypothetical protein [Sphingomonas melonis]